MADEKKQQLSEGYELPMSVNMKEVMGSMCNLSDLLIEDDKKNRGSAGTKKKREREDPRGNTDGEKPDDEFGLDRRAGVQQSWPAGRCA
ncbi:MAG: hypothetical protein LUC90_02820 [Lachnospiraceae bacterium]|nr:hypothetical protein [Lachnospiraceae bacterium]